MDKRDRSKYPKNIMYLYWFCDLEIGETGSR